MAMTRKFNELKFRSGYLQGQPTYKHRRKPIGTDVMETPNSR